MKYENLKDQGADAQRAITFLPKSIMDVVTRPKDSKHKKDWTIRIKDKKITDSNVLPKDLTIGMLGDRDAQEKKNVMIALGLGISVIVLLVYVLFLR
jgi:hypothetical protein